MPSSHRPLRALQVLATLSVMVAPVLRAQLAVTADVATNSAYMWRGTTMTNRLVLQPDVIATLGTHGWTFLAAANANVEPSRYSGALDISERGGTAAGVAEVDLWAEVTHGLGIAQLTFGTLRYVFPNSGGLTAAQNTLEVYGRVALDAPLAPTVQIWYDTWRVNGTYAEVSLAQDVQLFALPFHFAALQGINVSQTYDARENQGYFARGGFTHTDVSVGSSVAMGTVTATPSVHLLFAGDPKTRAISPVREVSSKLWFGVSFGWSHKFDTPAANTGAAAAANTVKP